MFEDRAEFLLNEIIRQRPDLSREKLLELAKQKKDEIKNISDYTALLLVAIDLGVKLPLRPTLTTPIGKLVDSLSNVSVKGRVLWVKEEKKFKRKDGTVGTYVRAGLGDSTGVCTVVFWDRSKSTLEELGLIEGNVIEIAYASTRKSLAGDVELHVGLRGEIRDRSDEVEEFPDIGDFLTPLHELTFTDKRVHTSGQVVSSPATITYTDDKGKERVLRQFAITDGKTVIRTVIWDDSSDYSWIKPGIQVVIFNARVKSGIEGELELHVGKTSHIAPYAGEKVEIRFAPSYLKNLRQGYNMVKVFVRVGSIGKLRTSATGKKTIGLYVLDQSSDATVVVIGDAAESISKLKPGDILSLSGMRVRFRGGDMYIFCDESTDIEINPTCPVDYEPPTTIPETVRLSDILPFHKVINVEGRVVKEPVEEEILQPIQVRRGEFFIEQDEIPARISYSGFLKDYADFESLRTGDIVRIYGAFVDTSFLIGESPYVSLRLRTYSKITKIG